MLPKWADSGIIQMRWCSLYFGEGVSFSNECLQHRHSCPWGFLILVRRKVSGTWQLLGITEANKQTDLSITLRFSVLQSVGWLPLHPWRSTLYFCFPQLGVFQSEEHWCVFFDQIRRKCVHICSLLFRFACSVSILV